MCGRDYSTYTDDELEIRYLNRVPPFAWPVVAPLPDIIPTYNMAPTQQGLVLRVANGNLRFDYMRWGLVPSWAKDLKSASKYSLINAKSEEIESKPSFREPFLKRRCIVPVSGFYEWSKLKTPKKPYCIRLKSQEIMSLAGVYEQWQSPDGKEKVDSYSILTTAACEPINEIHDRMPVILNAEEEAIWLDPSNHDIVKLKSFMKPFSPAPLEMYEISGQVNSPKNNFKEILLPG